MRREPGVRAAGATTYSDIDAVSGSFTDRRSSSLPWASLNRMLQLSIRIWPARALRADSLYRPSTYPYRLFAFGLSAGAIPASRKRARRAAHLVVASLVYPLRARSLVHSAALHRSARPGMSLVTHTTCKHLAYGAPVCCGHG